jgi:DNA-binding transcriptional ArsR family regulator
MDGSERRKLSDPRELRVLAHPLRLRILQVLFELGAATATQVAEQVGESPASCSWHLRQLAKHGFVEETGEGKGRQRPWRPAGRMLEWGDSGETGEVAAASDELSALFMEQEFDRLRRWQAWRRIDPPVWQDAAGFAQSSTWLTAGELAEVTAEFNQILRRHRDRALDPSTRPPGARRVQMFTWAVPAEPLPDRPPTTGEAGKDSS